MERNGSGVVYIATGASAQAEALRSLRSLRRYSPGTAASVFVDDAGRGGPLWAEADAAQSVTDPAFGYQDKILPLLERPYARTLFLDADTVVRRPLEPLFALLEGVDVAAMHDTWRAGWEVPVPDAFVELNTGVLLLGNSSAVDGLIGAWAARYHELQGTAAATARRTAEHAIYRRASVPRPTLTDQPSFRWVLWDDICAGRIRFAALPTETNVRLWMPNALAAGAQPWIVHDHRPDIEEVATALEQSPFARAWLPGPTPGLAERPSDALVVPRRWQRWLRQIDRLFLLRQRLRRARHRR